MASPEVARTSPSLRSSWGSWPPSPVPSASSSGAAGVPQDRSCLAGGTVRLYRQKNEENRNSCEVCEDAKVALKRFCARVWLFESRDEKARVGEGLKVIPERAVEARDGREAGRRPEHRHAVEVAVHSEVAAILDPFAVPRFANPPSGDWSLESRVCCAENEAATRLQDPVDFADRLPVPSNILDHDVRDDGIERSRWVRKPREIRPPVANAEGGSSFLGLGGGEEALGLIHPVDAGRPPREDARKVPRPTSGVEHALATDGSEEPKQDGIDDPLPVDVPARGVPLDPPRRRAVPSLSNRGVGEARQRPHCGGPSLRDRLGPGHAPFRTGSRGPNLPGMAALVFRAVERRMPLPVPRTPHAVEVRPGPERRPRRAVLRRAVEAEQLVSTRAERDRVEVAGVPADGAREPPMQVAPGMGRASGVVCRAYRIGGIEAMNRRAIPTVGGRHGTGREGPEGSLRFAWAAQSHFSNRTVRKPCSRQSCVTSSTMSWSPQM